LPSAILSVGSQRVKALPLLTSLWTVILPQTFRQMFGYAQAQPQPEPKLLPAAGLILRCVLVGRSQDEAEFRSIEFGQAFQNRLQVNHLSHHRLAQSNFSTQCQILVRIGEGFARRKSKR
jgi:hypothetical protein